MAPKLLPQEVAAIEAILAQPDHPDMHTIAAQFNCTYETIRYRKRNMAIRAALGWDNRSTGGRPSIITEEMENGVMEHVLRYVDAY